MAKWMDPSPFIFDGPVPPDKLIGRGSEIRVLRRWAAAGRFVALTAPRRYGKTSLISKLARDSAEQDGLVVVVADLYDVASTADLVIRLERAWAEHTPGRFRSTLGQALAGTEVGLSLAGTGFTIALAERPELDPLPALHTLLDLPRRVSQLSPGSRVLVVLDEFQSLSRVQGAEALLRSYAQHQRQVASYLFAGSQTSMLAEAFGDRSRPLYGQAETFGLGRLSEHELVDGIQDAFERSGRHPGGTLPRLVAASERHPQRAMLLAHLLWSRVPEGQVASDLDLDNTLAEATRRVDAEARAVLGGLSNGARKTLRAVAEYGSPTSARALRTLDLARTTANSASQALLRDGLVIREGLEWRLVDPLLARWIRHELSTRMPR